MTKKWRRLAMLSVAVGLTACTQSRDAIVVNPCEEVLRVRLSNVIPEKAPPETWDMRVVVPPISALLVDHALFDQGEEANAVNGYSAEVEGETGEKRFLPVPPSGETPVPVIIPASYCDLAEPAESV